LTETPGRGGKGEGLGKEGAARPKEKEEKKVQRGLRVVEGRERSGGAAY